MLNITGPQYPTDWSHPGLALLLLLLCLFTVAGNILVVVAVLTKNYLKTPTGYLIVSLAAADLLVGVVVMPINSVYEMANQRWIFASLTFCDVWHSIDILASTASIWNLCVISLDRYIANKDPIGYPDRVTTNRILCAIAVVWTMSASLSFPAIAVWRTSPELYTNQYVCQFTDNVYYVSLSSLLSFFIPLAIILFAYGKVFLIATRHSRSLRVGHKSVNGNADGPQMRVHYGRAQTTDTANKTPLNRPNGARLSAGRDTMLPLDSKATIYKNGSNRRASRLSENMALTSATARHCQKQIRAVNKAHPSTTEPLLNNNNNSNNNNSFNNNNNNNNTSSNAKHNNKMNRNRSASNQSSRDGQLLEESQDEASVEVKVTSKSLLIPPTRMPRALSERQIVQSSQVVPNKHRHSQGVITQTLSIEQPSVVSRGESIDTQVSLSSLSTVKKKSKHLAKYLKEQRAARTLGLVVGLFILCWLPFFIVNILIVICPTSCMTEATTKTVFTVLTWLGHLNSSLNPVIYSRFSREFRRAFKEILTCQKKQRPGLAAAMEGTLGVAFGQMAAMYGYRGPIPSIQRKIGVTHGDDDEEDDDE